MKQSTDREHYVPSEVTLEKLRRALQGDCEKTTPQKNKTKKRKSRR